MIDRAKFQEYGNPASFRRDLLVEAGTGIARLGDVVEPWQRDDFEATDAGWQRCVGRTSNDALSRAYLERPRGHSKTSDLAVMVVWALLFTPRIIRGYAAAADRDQARLLRDAIAKLIRLNPWIGSVLEVQNYVVRNTAANHPGRDSQLEILSSDVGSSYGLLPDFVVCDEITHWQGDGSLWHSLISSAAKRQTCMVVVISNAGTGMGESWQWNIREMALLTDSWYWSSLNGPQATWITPEILEEQRRILPPTVYQRLWLNEWVTGGDALEYSDIQAAIVHDGPMPGRESGYSFVAGLDLGVKNDHSALTILGANRETRRVRLALVQSWAPGPGGQVDLKAVEAAVLDAQRRYALRKVCYDPHQAALMAQQLKAAGCKVEEVPFAGRHLHTMASTLLDAFRSRQLELYDEPLLLKDLTRLSIVEKSFGWKLEASRGSVGHADRAFALAIALPAALKEAARRRFAGAIYKDGVLTFC